MTVLTLWGCLSGLSEENCFISVCIYLFILFFTKLQVLFYFIFFQPNEPKGLYLVNGVRFRVESKYIH